MIVEELNFFDKLCNVCIDITSIIAKESHTTYGTMCIFAYIIVPAVWTILLVTAYLLRRDYYKAAKICFRIGVGIIVCYIAYFLFYFIMIIGPAFT